MRRAPITSAAQPARRAAPRAKPPARTPSPAASAAVTTLKKVMATRAEAPSAKLSGRKERPRAVAKQKNEAEIQDEENEHAQYVHEEEDNAYRVKLRIGTVALPEKLVHAVAHVTRSQNRGALSAAGAALSEALRARTRSALPSQTLGSMLNTQDIPTLAYNEVEATAYAAHRLPGVYACISRVLAEIRNRAPDFTPRRMLDFGSGPGTAVWAAHEEWPEDLRTFTLVDRSPHMARLAKTLTGPLTTANAVQLSWRRNLQHVPPHDLVSCSYVLSELQSDRERAGELAKLWDRLEPGGVIAIVEPGTPLGFQYIRRAREQLLGFADANVLAPCTHNLTCPMKADSWCHFAQRVQRTTWQMAAKRDASVNWEDEKFSYVAIRKGGQTKPADYARLVRAPMKRGGHVMMVACTTTGHLENRTVTKAQGKQRFRGAVKAKWGDGFRTAIP